MENTKYDPSAALAQGGSEDFNKEKTEQNGRDLTFGEKAVGLTFNPGGHAEVNNIKRSFADTIDYLNNLRNTAKTENNGEKIRMYSVAITECQSAQMWAVKAATWQY